MPFMMVQVSEVALQKIGDENDVLQKQLVGIHEALHDTECRLSSTEAAWRAKYELLERSAASAESVAQERMHELQQQWVQQQSDLGAAHQVLLCLT
jgi:flagellar capping protein FliD